MKISVNAIRDFNQRFNCAGDPAPGGVDKLVQHIGAQLAAVEEVISFGAKYEGVVIVTVVECHKHENSDHLSVCLIDDGGVVDGADRDADGRVQVVCGASNVRAGLTVAWLPPGSTVPSSYDTEPFVLNVREIRGVVSNGMLASPKELALGDNHDGILEIDEDVAPGTLFAEKYNLTGDVVIDMENKMFTHRPDLFGMLGVAREIAGIQGQKFTSPQWYRIDASIPDQSNDSGLTGTADEPTGLRVEVRNEIPDLVPRFAAVPMANITIKPSPVWLQVELSRLGVRPINNVVDLTNYYMLLTGQPLHAYDYDKVLAQDTIKAPDGASTVADSSGAGERGAPTHATIVVRGPHPDEKLLLLNGKTIEPRPDAILIASASNAIGLGGVMGGGDTEIDDTTKNIILECASFDMYSIRRTSMAHGLFSDAVTRFNKGQSPLQNLAVLAKIVEDIQQIVGGTVAGPVVDDNHLSADVMERNALFPDVSVSSDFINHRLGLRLTAGEMTELLCNVEFSVQVDAENLQVRAPFWRTDIEIPEDVVEEVGRLYGFDKLPLELPKRDIMPATKNAAFELKARLRETLSRSGANETLGYSFVDGSLLDKASQDKSIAFKLSNALSPELQYYRLSLTPSLLDKVHANIKAGYDEFALFELGKVHVTPELDGDGLPKQFDRLALVFAAEAKKATQTYQGAAFYQARKYLLTLFDGKQFPFTLIPFAEADFGDHKPLQQMAAPFDPARAAVVHNGEQIVGVIGEYIPSVQKALKLPKYSAGFELFLSFLGQPGVSPYQPQSRFPKVWQDICLRVPVGVSYKQLHDYVWEALGAGQREATTMTLTPIDIYIRPEDTAYKQITFRFTTTSYDRTMTDAEVAASLSAVAAGAADKFGAQRI